MSNRINEPIKLFEHTYDETSFTNVKSFTNHLYSWPCKFSPATAREAAEIIRTLCKEIDEMKEVFKTLEEPAAMYKTLRSFNWYDGRLTVTDGASVQLGRMTYSGEMLDDKIKEYMK